MAAGSSNSHAGLFPRQDRVLSPVVRVPSDSTTDGGNKDTRVLHEKQDEDFETSIINSELISRGWVYQEILQTPANLFCTGNQLWWSCSSSSCSQTFPWGMLNLYTSKNEDTFCDGIRERKLGIKPGKGGKEATFAWNDVIMLYSRTSVTVPDDRLVALAGIADLYVHEMRLLGNGVACYHSGVWSIEAIPQLLWRIDGEPPSSYLPASHPIPSWSPLCHQGGIRVEYPALWTSQYFVKYVSMATSGLDRFGRCRTREDGTLTLRGVLIDVDFSDDHARLYPREFERYTANIWWDNSENRKLANADEGSSWCGLLCAGETGLSSDYYGGLLLRACDDPSSPKNKGRTWQRCGYFNIDIHEYSDVLDGISRAFGFERYGVELCWDDKRALNLKDTGTSQDLEDVYIV